MGEIKSKLEVLYKQTADIQEQIKALQAECKHDVGWTEGLSLYACIHPVLFCKECDLIKPIDYPLPPQNNEPWIVSGC
jgi:hypothetical protein